MYNHKYESYNNNFENHKNSTIVNSSKTKSTKGSRPKSRKKNKTKVYQVDYSKTGIDLSKYNKIKKQLYCSLCRNTIMKSGLNLSCKHILCSSCLSRQILKSGFKEIQNKLFEDILNIECPCKSGNVEITLENLISLLFIDEECLNHGEFQTCPKCSMWTSVLTKMNTCSIHNEEDAGNKNEIIIKDYCLDCQKEVCSLCIKEKHSDHNIKSIENILDDIKSIKLKNQNFKQFFEFIKLLENNFNNKYDNVLSLNISKIDEGIKLLNQIKNNFIEVMNQKIKHSRNLFTLLKYVYYFYYKDLATVKNNINVIDFLFHSKYELQNIEFNPKKEFSEKVDNLYELIKEIKIDTFDCELNIKNNFSFCVAQKSKAHEGYIFDLLDLNNKYLVSTGEDRKIKIWSLDSNILSPCLENVSLEHSSSVFSLCKSKNEKIFFSGSYGEIKIWSTEDFSLMNTLYGHKDYVTHMEIIQKKYEPSLHNLYKDYLCSCSYDNTIKIWDLEHFVCISTLSGHTDHINYFIQKEPGFIISCSSDKTVKLWNIEKNECYLTLDNENNSPFYALAMTSDGRIISSSFNTINIYDLNIKKCNILYSENNKGVYKLVVLPGNKLISSCFKYINFWDLNNLQWLYEIEAHKNYITCLLLFKDQLITASDDGDIKMWE